MPNAIVQCKKAFSPASPSDWVYLIFLTCIPDEAIGVWFKHGQHTKKVKPERPGRFLATSPGAPSFCCYYPGTAGGLGAALYQVAQVYSYGGEFVRDFLYKKQGYVPCSLQQPCGTCPGSPCCSVPMPATLTATFSDGNGNCACSTG